jgi:hypothetical protein
MRCMRAWGIGVSRTSACVFGLATALLVYSLTLSWRSNTAAPRTAQPCFVWLTPDRDYAITVLLRDDGYPIPGAQHCIVASCGSTTPSGMEDWDGC